MSCSPQIWQLTAPTEKHLYAVAAVSGAEDPEKMLDQAVNEMQSDLVRLRQASAQVPYHA